MDPQNSSGHEPGSTPATRRDFLASTAALAASGLVIGLADLSEAHAQERRVDLNRLARDLMPTTVRFVVDHEGSPAKGSGTLVETPEFFKPLIAPDEALVISAGHVFHDLNDMTEIKAHLFKGFDSRLKPTGYDEVEARCIGYRSAKEDGQPPDVAILAVKLPGGGRGVKKAVLGSAETSYEFGDQAITIGSPGGNDPIWLNSRVLAFTPATENRGANVMTIAKPEGGHSGGGMYNADGELIAICSGSGTVPRGTIDFVVPDMKDVIVADFDFEHGENEIIVRSNAQADAYRRRMTPDWAEFATGRGSFASIPEAREFMHTLLDRYRDAQAELTKIEKGHALLSENLTRQQGDLPASTYSSLQEALEKVSGTAIETARKNVSKYRPLE